MGEKEKGEHFRRRMQKKVRLRLAASRARGNSDCNKKKNASVSSNTPCVQHKRKKEPLQKKSKNRLQSFVETKREKRETTTSYQVGKLSSLPTTCEEEEGLLSNGGRPWIFPKGGGEEGKTLLIQPMKRGKEMLCLFPEAP